MPKRESHSRASCIALAAIWQLVAIVPSIHAQTQIQSTQDDSSDACTRTPGNVSTTGAPDARFPCLSFEPVSTTSSEATSPLPFSLSKQETSLVLSSSVSVSQSFNSTSQNAVSTSTFYTTLRGTELATSTSTPEEIQIMTDGTHSSKGTANIVLPQNSTTNSGSSVPTTALPQDGDGTTNATMFPMVLQTVTFTTTICPSGGWV